MNLKQVEKELNIMVKLISNKDNWRIGYCEKGYKERRRKKTKRIGQR